MCDAYREQIDTLLVFAGLFSAVVTAFAAESYQWLQQCRQFALSSGLPGPVSVRINSYWFLSLTLSLSCALIAILAKQWLREYERDYGLSHSQSLAVRQMKFEGLRKWHVNAIVSFLPLVLQLALALFMIGVIELLWKLNSALAIMVTCLATTVFGLYVATTIMPAVYFVYWHFKPDAEQSTAVQCPYKSPQSWLALRVLLSYLEFLFPQPYKAEKLYRSLPGVPLTLLDGFVRSETVIRARVQLPRACLVGARPN
ncbi:hypothetical protein AURDEDRAFT_68014 [Auricularia subglabra TFB-10046 SS5]|nr:hypothetical protein AURDEDRAFT_68014 [Auricularia subglabra TFB-10046 SS5]